MTKLWEDYQSDRDAEISWTTRYMYFDLPMAAKVEDDIIRKERFGCSGHGFFRELSWIDLKIGRPKDQVRSEDPAGVEALAVDVGRAGNDWVGTGSNSREYLPPNSPNIGI